MFRNLIRPCVLLSVALAFAFVATATAQTNYVNYEGKQTSPIRLSPDGTRLFAVNTPDARLSVYDVANPSNPILIAEIPVGLEPVSVNPRTADEAWVVNEVSDSISVVSVSRGIVTDTLYVKDEPADVVFANGRAFVSASRNNQVAVFDVATHNLVTNIAVLGENPRALAVSPDGSKVYAAFALSGNRTTLVPPTLAPPQSPPVNVNLPAPPQVGLIVDATDPSWSGVIQYTMPDNDVVEINTTTLTTNRYFSRVGTVNLGLAVHPVSGDLFVANADAGNLTHFEPAIRGRFYTNRLTRIAIGNGAVAPFNLDPFATTNFPDLFAKSNALAQPTAVAFDPSGNFLWLAAFGSDRVAKLDTNGNVLARIEIGNATGASVDPRNKRGPRGLAVHPSASRLYVLNRLANSISIVDTAGNTVLREFAAGSVDPTPAAIRQGRGFLYDAKLSGNGTVSCASCHIDAEMDLLAWDLGDPNGVMVTNATFVPQLGLTLTNAFHPMKGPMTTQTLRGLNGLDPLHWRGDRTNFLQFNGAFPSLMGGPQLSAPDMQAYRDFINTVVFQANPNQNLDRTLPTNFAGGNPVQGRFTFTNEQYTAGLTCNTCHSLPTGTAKVLIPAAALQESQDFKIPHLRNLYQKTTSSHTNGAVSTSGFGFIHDGTFSDIFTFLSQPVFATFATNTVRKQNLSAFMACFDTGTPPAVGYTRTINSSNVAALSIVNDWALLEGQAVATNIGLIAKGTIDGQVRGLMYQPASNNYVADKTGVGPFTHAQLVTKLQAGDTLTFMGVPPGSARRMGIDRDQDNILDGDAVAPGLQVARSAESALLTWSTNSYWFVLESALNLTPTNWATVIAERGIATSNVVVTNSLADSFRFFRLRRTW